MDIVRSLLKFLGWIIAGILLVVIGFFIFLSLTDYKPKPVEKPEYTEKSTYKADTRRQFSLLTWNIGYGAMGAEADFFYDGGTMTRPPFDLYQHYLNGIYNEVSRADTIDFIFLQEVDRDARRSYYIDQEELLSGGLNDFNTAFARNYDVKFIPFPLHSPLGSVKAGLMNLMRFTPESTARLASPANFSWPKKLFFLDRCMMVSRFPLSNRKEMVLINLHNSAFTDGAVLRTHEMELLRSTVIEEYNKGNYVIAGGDWNSAPPDFQPDAYRSGDIALKEPEQIRKGFLPDTWQWVYDPDYPTNRDARTAYRRGMTPVHVFDFFLVSPNVQVNAVQTLSNGFRWSDHHPVYLNFSLKDESVAIPNPALNNK